MKRLIAIIIVCVGIAAVSAPTLYGQRRAPKQAPSLWPCTIIGYPSLPEGQEQITLASHDSGKTWESRGSLCVSAITTYRLVVGPLPQKHAHAQQPKPKADAIGEALKAEVEATTAFETAKANLEAARSNTRAVLFREMAEAGVKPSECAGTTADGKSDPFACISRDPKSGAWQFTPRKQVADKK